MSQLERIRQFEGFLFFFLTLLFSLPVILLPVYHCIDTPAHLYNAVILKDLLFHENSLWTSFFEINKEPVPNWGGHFAITIMLKAGLNPLLANKLILLTYLIAFAYIFRFIVLYFTGGRCTASYLVFLHLHTFQLYSGFYNFCLSIPLMLVSFYAVSKYFSNREVKWLIITGILSTLIFFFHLLTAVFVLLFIVCVMFSRFYRMYLDGERWKIILRAVFKDICQITSALVPLLTLIFIYFAQRPPVLQKTFIRKKELIIWLFKLRSSVVYDWSHADWLIIFGTIFWCVFIWCFIKWLKQAFNKANNPTHFKISSLLLLTFLSLGVLFLLPDSDGYGSVISVRIIFLSFVFASIAIAVSGVHQWVIAALSSLGIILGLYILNETFTEQKKMSHEISEIMRGGETARRQ